MSRKKSYIFSHTYFVSSECKCLKWQALNLEDSSLTMPFQICYNYHHLMRNSCIWMIARWARGNFGRHPYFSWFFLVQKNQKTDEFKLIMKNHWESWSHVWDFHHTVYTGTTFQNFIYHACFWSCITFIYISSFQKYLQRICLWE